MAVRPQRNLAPESEAWGRSVDSDLTDLRNAVTRLEQDNRNAFSALSGQLTALQGALNVTAALAQTASKIESRYAQGSNTIPTFGSGIALGEFNATAPDGYNTVTILWTINAESNRTSSAAVIRADMSALSNSEFVASAERSLTSDLQWWSGTYLVSYAVSPGDTVGVTNYTYVMSGTAPTVWSADCVFIFTR